MAEPRKRQPPSDANWTVGSHGVPMPPSLVNSTPPPTADSQTAPLPDPGQEVRPSDDTEAIPETYAITFEQQAQPADSSQGLEKTQAIALKPQANEAETGHIQPAPDAGADRDPRTGDRAVHATARSIPVPVQTEPRGPWFRIVLLLLLMGVLIQVAVYTPEKLQAMAADTMVLLLSTDIPQSRTAPALSSGPLVGRLEVTSAPSGSELFVDGEHHGVTPAELVLPVGVHDVTLVSPVGTVRRTVRVTPGHRTLFSEAIFPGWLVVTSAVKVEVRIDGKTVGPSGDREHVLTPGSHQLELLNPNDGAHTMHTVEIFPGQITTLDAGGPLGN